jgi:hypothetical protein
MLASFIGTMDFNDQVLKHSDGASELRAFLLSSGTAFLGWVFKKLGNLF